MSNFLSIEEAIEKSGINPQDFEKNYVETGIISTQVNDGIKQIELSEFFRVFPQQKINSYNSEHKLELELALKDLKIENLEYQVANLQRQLVKQDDEYNWLRSKFDNTTLLLEQKLDTSEVDKYKQEIRLLSHQAIQWEKKYNTLLAATELKALSRENRELKEQLSIYAKPPQTEIESHTNNLQDKDAEDKLSMESLKAEIMRLRQIQAEVISSKTTIETHTQESQPHKPQRRKIFGIF